MEEYLNALKEQIDKFLGEVNVKAEEARENFDQFRDVFGKEYDIQSENFQDYRDRIEAKLRELLNSEDLKADLREEIEFALRDAKGGLERLLELLRKGKA